MNDKLIAEARALIARLSEGTKVSPDDALHMLTVLCSALEDAEKQIPRWIPVSERLPRYNQDVLTFSPGMAMHIVFNWYNGYYGEDDKEWYEGWQTGRNITHWMPLPKGAEETK